MLDDRRSHSRITAELSPEMLDQVNTMLTTGKHTYQDIVNFLADNGIEISLASVGRYGKGFLTKLQKLKIMRDQAKTILDCSEDRPATEMLEATNQVLSQMILEYFIDLPDMDGEDATEMIKATAMLQKSSVAIEKLKMDYQNQTRKKADQAVKAIEDTAKKKGLDPETLAIIKEQVYGIV
jgi:hypothetical protein